jgi:hypothetical protein
MGPITFFCAVGLALDLPNAGSAQAPDQGTCRPFHDWFAGRGYLDVAQNRVADGLGINQPIALAAQGTDYCDIGIGAQRPGPVVLSISVLAVLPVVLLATIIGGAVGGPKDDRGELAIWLDSDLE